MNAHIISLRQALESSSLPSKRLVPTTTGNLLIDNSLTGGVVLGGITLCKGDIDLSQDFREEFAIEKLNHSEGMVYTNYKLTREVGHMQTALYRVIRPSSFKSLLAHVRHVEKEQDHAVWYVLSDENGVLQTGVFERSEEEEYMVGFLTACRDRGHTVIFASNECGVHAKKGRKQQLPFSSLFGHQCNTILNFSSVTDKVEKWGYIPTRQHKELRIAQVSIIKHDFHVQDIVRIPVYHNGYLDTPLAVLYHLLNKGTVIRLTDTCGIANSDPLFQCRMLQSDTPFTTAAWRYLYKEKKNLIRYLL